MNLPCMNPPLRHRAKLWTSAKVPGDDFKFLEAVGANEEVFSIRGDGYTSINGGGLLVKTGGETIEDGGLLAVL